ncbi:MAG: HlyD family type I secretion periplasmic adaptor subunit [Pseudomonadota bacterium]
MNPAKMLAGPAGSAAPKDDGWGAQKYIRFGLICVLILGGGFGGWAATASLKGAVIASGQLRVESNRQVVQHLDGGVVGDILVRDGDVVQAGDVLIRLDDTLLRSELITLESQLFEIVARRGRLEAVQIESGDIQFDDELLSVAKENEEVASLIDGQVALFLAQRESNAKQRDVLVERKSQFAEQIVGIDAQLSSYERQSELIEEELVGVRQLLKRGNIQKTRLLSLEREAARLIGEAGQLTAQRAQLQGQISEIDIELLRMDATTREEAITELRELGFRELELKERRLALKERLSRLDIRAPRMGVVIDSTVHALKAVIRPAEPILYIVPNDANMVIDARVEPINRDSIFTGQEAVLVFSAFNTRTTPELFGTISKVSPDSTVDEQTGMAFYKAEVALNEGEIVKLEGQELVAGMPVEVYIQTGDRTPFNYMLRPVTDYFNRAMREE